MRKHLLKSLAVPTACIAAAVPLVGCGSSSGHASANTNARHCWTTATQMLADHQAHVFLDPAKGLKVGNVHKLEHLDESSDMTVAERWSAGKSVVLKAQHGERYLGPTLAWLRATKARCGSLEG